jgi:enoyl-CoA hydratase/carnithine racemase
MILLARLIDGPTALNIGLTSELLPDAAALHARADELARTVAGHAPITLQVTKEALRRLQARLGDDNIDDLIRLAYGSADFREGMAAFLGKRAPKWSGT